MPCYNGPDGTEGVGECKGGVRTCDPSGDFYGPCAGQVTPTAKNCATPNIDESCDGSLGPCTNPPLFAALYGGTDLQIGYAVTADPAGNMILAGTYKDMIDFGAGPLDPSGGMFLVKLDPSGGVIWQKKMSGGYSRSLATDAQGNIFVFGPFKGAMNWGNGPLMSGPDGGLFLAKLDPDGKPIYSKAFDVAVSDDRDWVVAAAPAGEVVLTAAFTGTVDLGSGPLTSAGSRDVFVAKLDAAGGPLFSKRFGGAGGEFAGSAAIGPQGEIVVVGSFAGAADFGGGPITATGSDVFVVKLDAAGAHVWSKGLGGTSNQGAMGVAIDPSGGVGFVGASGGGVDLGGGVKQASGSELTCFLGKLSAAGAHVFSQAYGCHVNEFVPLGPRVAADPSGAFVVTGSFRGAADFGMGPVNSLDADAFVFKIDSGGAPVWARTFSSKSYDQGLDVATDAAGNVLLTGHVENSVDFGGGLLVSGGDFDVYLVKLPP